MNDMAGIKAFKGTRVHTTDLGPVMRIDLNMLGADLEPHPVDGWEAWSRVQNRRLCDALDTELSKRGGSFDSIAEWSVAVNRHYDLQDMRNVRTSRWRDGFGSAITTLPWAHQTSTKSVSIQTVSYVPKDPATHFLLRAWQPACLYDCSFLGLSPATVVEIGEISLIYLSGVVAWDKEIQPLAGDDPRAQMRLILQMIQNVFREAGGTPADVVRLRPFVASKAVAQILREECSRLSVEQGCPEPTLLIAEESSFWDAPSLFAEIQVMGVVGRHGCKIGQEECQMDGITNATTRIRRTTTPVGTLLHVADLRAPAGMDPSVEATAIGEQVRDILGQFGLGAAEVCLVVVYASLPESISRITAALHGQINPTALHVVHCPPMPELNGGTLKLELTTWQQR